jgi:hypothetical protein
MTNRNPKDYTLNKEAAKGLAEKIQKHWHDKGYDSVRVWVEDIHVYNREGTRRITTRFEINSNIIQSVSSLENQYVL